MQGTAAYVSLWTDPSRSSKLMPAQWTARVRNQRKDLSTEEDTGTNKREGFLVRHATTETDHAWRLHEGQKGANGTLPDQITRMRQQIQFNLSVRTTDRFSAQSCKCDEAIVAVDLGNARTGLRDAERRGLRSASKVTA